MCPEPITLCFALYFRRNHYTAARSFDGFFLVKLRVGYRAALTFRLFNAFYHIHGFYYYQLHRLRSILQIYARYRALASHFSRRMTQ